MDEENRIALQSVPMHYLPKGIENFEDYWFPIYHEQVRDILGKILTQIEAMNLPERTEKASKAIFTQMVWHWFDEVMENSATASPGSGLNPINRAFPYRLDPMSKKEAEYYEKLPPK